MKVINYQKMYPWFANCAESYFIYAGNCPLPGIGVELYAHFASFIGQRSSNITPIHSSSLFALSTIMEFMNNGTIDISPPLYTVTVKTFMLGGYITTPFVTAGKIGILVNPFPFVVIISPLAPFETATWVVFLATLALCMSILMYLERDGRMIHYDDSIEISRTKNKINKWSVYVLPAFSCWFNFHFQQRMLARRLKWSTKPFLISIALTSLLIQRYYNKTFTGIMITATGGVQLEKVKVRQDIHKFIDLGYSLYASSPEQTLFEMSLVPETSDYILKSAIFEQHTPNLIKMAAENAGSVIMGVPDLAAENVIDKHPQFKFFAFNDLIEYQASFIGPRNQKQKRKQMHLFSTLMQETGIYLSIFDKYRNEASRKAPRPSKGRSLQLSSYYGFFITVGALLTVACIIFLLEQKLRIRGAVNIAIISIFTSFNTES